jgi:hypothetical protein
MIAGLALTASCSPYQQVFFVGRVYDGATGERLTSYNISLEYLTTTVTGTVDGNGYYNVGPLPPYQDFTITISSASYRSFMSHNAMYKDPGTKTQVSYYYDAYLFPKSLQSPAVTFNINGTGTEAALPTGFVRLQPTLPSETYGLTPAGVDVAGGAPTNQVWQNAQDLQASTFSGMFNAGSIAIPAGALVYGVAYDVTIFGVDGFAEYDSAATGKTFISGVDGDQSYTLTPLIQTPLALVFNSASQAGVLTPDYSLTLVFNQPIMADAALDPNGLTFFLNEQFSITSPHVDTTGMGNVLNAPPETRMPSDFAGVNFSISGNTLKLTWSQSSGLMTKDPGDPIYSVTYGGLNAFPILPANNPSAPTSLVSQYLSGGSSVTVQGLAVSGP